MADAGDAGNALTRVLHDLRSPLAVVEGFAQLLERRGDELTAEQRADYAGRIVAAAAEMRQALDVAPSQAAAREEK